MRVIFQMTSKYTQGKIREDENSFLKSIFVGKPSLHLPIMPSRMLKRGDLFGGSTTWKVVFPMH